MGDLDGPTERDEPDTVREPNLGVPGAGEIVAGRYEIDELLGSGGISRAAISRTSSSREDRCRSTPR